MFTPDAIIDTVQTGKKTFINTFVTNEAFKTPMIEFVDAQAEYTKKAAKVSLDAATKLTQEAIKAGQEAAKFDYNKFYDTVSKAFTVAKK